MWLPGESAARITSVSPVQPQSLPTSPPQWSTLCLPRHQDDRWSTWFCLKRCIAGCLTTICAHLATRMINLIVYQPMYRQLCQITAACVSIAPHIYTRPSSQLRSADQTHRHPFQWSFRCLDVFGQKKYDGLKSCVKSSLVCLNACPFDPPVGPLTTKFIQIFIFVGKTKLWLTSKGIRCFLFVSGFHCTASHHRSSPGRREEGRPTTRSSTRLCASRPPIFWFANKLLFCVDAELEGGKVGVTPR